MDILAAIKRREEAQKATGEVTAPVERGPSRCKSIGQHCGARACRSEEARFVGCWESGNCEGGEEAVGES